MSRRTVQETASLHEKAVQAIATGEVAPVPTRRRKAPEKRSSEVEHIRVHPEVWAKAKEVIARSYSRIEIISATEVMVR